MDKVLARLKAILAVVVKIATAVGNAFQAVATQVNAAKMLITEVLGAAGTLVGIGSITGWQYAAIIGGVAVVLAVERQPSNTTKAVAAKAAQLKTALIAAQKGGKLDVMIEDILKVL